MLLEFLGSGMDQDMSCPSRTWRMIPIGDEGRIAVGGFFFFADEMPCGPPVFDMPSPFQGDALEFGVHPLPDGEILFEDVKQPYQDVGVEAPLAEEREVSFLVRMPHEMDAEAMP